MIQIDNNNPPVKKCLTNRELFLKLAEIPELELNYMAGMFFKNLLKNKVRGPIELKVKNGGVEITLCQPNKADLEFFS